MATNKISRLTLAAGFTAGAAECVRVKKYLDDNGIPYDMLTYADDAQHPAVFAAFNTWNFGPGVNPETRQFNDFPIVTWTEHDDGGENFVEVATSLFEVMAKLPVERAPIIEDKVAREARKEQERIANINRRAEIETRLLNLENTPSP